MQVVNITLKADIGHPIDVSAMSEKFNSEYNPETFPATIIKKQINGHTVSFSFFRTGKVIVTGCKDVNEITVFEEAIKEYTENFRIGDVV